MSQPTYYQLPNEPGLSFRQHLNENILAQSCDFAGTAAPTSPNAGMRWLDTSTTPAVLKRRNLLNTAWDVFDISYKPKGLAGTPVSVATKLTNSASVDEYMGGSTDATSATQLALNNNNVVRFISGTTYNLTGNVSVPGNRKIIVEKGAIVINTGGRFTSYDVDNVHWQIDGKVRSVSMSTAPAKNGWPAIANSYYGDERGFIEFGGASTTTPRSGFTVSGSGSVSGDWTGTAAAATSADVNKKGICAFNAKNVLVRDLEVFGFIGEAVYFWGLSVNCINIKFSNILSRDNKFNALNFNVVGPTQGLVIENCMTLNCYSGIESSSGDIVGNKIYSSKANGIWTGVGAGEKISIRSNVVIDCGAVGIYSGWSSLMDKGVSITDNTVEGSGTFGILATFCKDITVLNNVVRGHGRLAAGWGIQVSDSNYGQVSGNTVLLPGSFSSGDIFTSYNTTNLIIGQNCQVPTSTTPNITREYKEGVFTPVPTGLSVVVGSGTVTYSGYYTKIGRFVHWGILITPTGTATTASTISATTFGGIPFVAAKPSTCQAATAGVSQLLNGYITGQTVFAPSWSATNAQVVITGSMIV